MSLLSTQLPAELLPMVLAPQFPRDLASTSLVCRQWQRIAFPYLYHAVYLSTSAHLKVLTERLLEKDVPDSLSIPVHLRCLTFGGSIDNNRDMKYLDSIIPRLDRLSCLYWVLPFTPDHFAWFTACPKLKSVDLLPQNIWEDDEWVERLPE
ncbi:unnamed protein product [Rhizoctonia solani]|uniref:F-box domain-containing protein n=1 Tax=Rhizoctonia solani TaxID=456999 RepID=A0A8H3BA13_9AGAM|nr:unnamed protein product [Rhizoctonia solani]